jgi:hypothetical protein
VTGRKGDLVDDGLCGHGRFPIVEIKIDALPKIFHGRNWVLSRQSGDADDQMYPTAATVVRPEMPVRPGPLLSCGEAGRASLLTPVREASAEARLKTSIVSH